MKNLRYFTLVIIGMLFSSFVLKKENSTSGPIASDCTCKGKKMYGKVQFVTSFPDVKVQMVTAFPDLKVQMVNAFPDKCGQWQVVTAFPDVKIQIVESFPDVKVQIVDAFPGKP